MKQYIDSQQHWEDSINADIERDREYAKEMERQINQQIDNQINEQYNDYINEQLKTNTMKKDRMRLFSKKDGRTFFQDLHKIKAEIEIFFDSMPVKLKSWMYEATIIIDALQKLDDALQEGEPADKAIDFILAQIKGESQERIYESVKRALHSLIERIESAEQEVDGIIFGVDKAKVATSQLMDLANLSELEADTVVQNAVYIYKS